MTEPSPTFIYKIITTPLWEQAQEAGIVPGMPIDTQDGYMHFSTAEQLRETLSLHFKGRDGLVVLRVAAEILGDALKWEPSRGGALFPHLYAELPTALVDWSAPVSVDQTGAADLPEML